MFNIVFLTALALTAAPVWAKRELKQTELQKICLDHMKSIPGKYVTADMEPVCAQVQSPPTCASVNGAPIYFYEKKGTGKSPKRILAKALIHGDERLAGTVARAWMLRLAKIDPRNTWRVIPVVNPDGWKAKTRTNANGVDLNRNFPTKNWEAEAIGYWRKKMKSDPRRNPGTSAASEPETKCLLQQLDEFKPDFIISVHTPLGVLDLDGPKVKPPAFNPLPWTTLGNFPGSLGRYMWVDRKVPVLTIELKGNEDVNRLEGFDHLQDISGTVAIQTEKQQRFAEQQSENN
jgi:protein MpaA